MAPPMLAKDNAVRTLLMQKGAKRYALVWEESMQVKALLKVKYIICLDKNIFFQPRPTAGLFYVTEELCCMRSGCDMDCAAGFWGCGV